ncbi:MAG: 3-dehydroquinate synthase [Nitrospirae bacterium]|nr:3-dehydroquinate synthase [Nitrospirota bacterium]
MKEIQQNFQVSYSLPVIFTRDVFSVGNKALSQLLSRTGRKNKVLIIIDSKVFNATPKLMDKIEQYANIHSDIMEFVCPPFIIKGGEACKKDMSEVDKIHALIDKHHLCRHSFILVIGGGAVLDAAGYAAATAHRGIRLIRLPTTTLSQNDAGVGVKNAINAFGRKNFLGTFAPPFAIINDFDFLNTLPKKALRAGISEAVKVALIKDKEFFDFLYNERQKLASFEPEAMEKMIIRCAELHIEHIGTSGDPFEYGSSRPLDFGHWSAHKIEELTGGKVQHGEAVAAGIALDSLYSFHTGLINEIELRKIFSTLKDIGFELYHWSLNWMDINKALQEFQEHLGGRLTIPLLSGIGNRKDVNEIDTVLLKKCVNILSETAEGKERKHGSGKRPDAGKRGSRKILP